MTVTGRVHAIGQNVLQPSVQTESSKNTSHLNVFFFFSFLEEACSSNITITLYGLYSIIIMCINNNNFIINNYARLQDLILIIKKKGY
jgi:hypothetical protein